MKIFTGKEIIKKLIIVITVVILLTAAIPTNVSYAAVPGGTLLKPIFDLLLGVGDFIMDITQNLICKTETTLLRIDLDSDIWEFIVIGIAVVVGIIVVGGIGIGLVAAGSAILGALEVTISTGAIVVATAGTIITTSIGGGVVAGMLAHSEWFDHEKVVPMFRVTPEEIFSGKINWLDVNFFKEDGEVYEEYEVIESGYFETIVVTLQNGNCGNTVGAAYENIDQLIADNGTVLFKEEHGFTGVAMEEGKYYEAFKTFNDMFTEINRIRANEVPQGTPVPNATFNEIFDKMNGWNESYAPYVDTHRDIINKTNQELNSLGYNQINIDAKGPFTYNGFVGASMYYQCYDVVMIGKGTPGVESQNNEIITLKIFCVRENKTETRTETKPIITLGESLRPTIAKWYYAVRNFVLVVMMVILVYIGIRIILSSVASEKSKYKNMLMDWVVAICLVFTMHYIMSFAMNIVEAIREIFSTVNNKGGYVIVYDYDEKLKTAFEKANIDVTGMYDSESNTITWDAKNLLGIVRVRAAMTKGKNFLYFGYAIAYVVLVFQTVFFLVTYLRRALYLTFFTIIAPLVAMTYPIDKIHDGKAQAFDLWLKEYIFNLMIQPMHLLLYTILISNAFDLASTNILYTLVAVGFMMPAEKFVRKMFGFDKAQTPGFLNGAGGAALLMTGMNKLLHRKPAGGGGHKHLDSEESNNDEKVKVKDDSNVDPFLLAQKAKGNSNKENSNPINVLSNQEKERQMNEMNEIMARSQVPNFGDINPNIPKKANNIGYDISEDVKKKFQGQQEKLTKAQQQEPKQEPKQTTKGMQGKAQKSKLARIKSGITAASKVYAKNKLKRVGMNLATGKTIRDMAKFAGGITLGAGGAIMGATIGLSSGEVKNISGYGTTLGVAGYALGSRDIKQDPDMEAAAKEYERGQFESEEEYRQYKLEEQRRAYANNDKYLEQLRTYLKLEEKEDSRKYMSEYGEFLDAGITDMEDFATAIKTVEDEGWSREMAVTAAKYYKKAGGKPKNMNKRDRENIEFQYKNIARANGIPDDDVEETVKIMLKNLDKFGSIKDDLTQV